ncbi:hypothetical protein [Neobacillus mesonae]|uniref:GIY-YIG domain-containing protein n=1 Tax=Neobacillus mesonae TaxID=1193713 RepID=A0A3Q9QQW7_9BACI|nr:hypothetical protein [Neobacillus mesonae]AZU60114.1 hypothetical protein CHR53_01875 [Neobacillus mesonae]
MKYYVYTHTLDGEIIYCGKGCRSRAVRFTFRSKLWNEIVGENSDRIKVDIVQWFDSEEDAFDFETKLTALYKSVGLCRANESIGTQLSDKAKHLISERLKGENDGVYGVGKGRNNRSRKTVAIFPDGRRIETASQKEMATSLNISARMVQRIMKTGEPYKPFYMEHKALEGLIIKYSS